MSNSEDASYKDAGVINFEFDEEFVLLEGIEAIDKWVRDQLELPLTINEWVETCHRHAMEVGWWQGIANLDDANFRLLVASKLALVHSEISEALEGVRKNLMDDHLPHRQSVEVELADACIRIFDLAGALNLDLEGAIIEKMAYNTGRDDHKLENRAKDGGKKF